jgi:hypothetical protein
MDMTAAGRRVGIIYTSKGEGAALQFKDDMFAHYRLIFM